VVQRIVMVPAASGPIAPGDRVVVQATLEAQRGTDIFAVPHLPVGFAIVSAPGGGASVLPDRSSSGDSGVALTTVRTGDLPGDTVVSATAGTASAQLTLHAEAPVSAAARVTPPVSGDSRPASAGRHGFAVAALLVAAGFAAALILGVMRRPRREGTG
jgi:hypothetical protein